MSRCSVEDRRTAEKLSRNAMRSEYAVLMAEGASHIADACLVKQKRPSKKPVLSLEPCQPVPYFNLGAALNNAGKIVRNQPSWQKPL